ncbi:conserved hypothetical protein [Cellulomonas flavigena DSM 20109]|uniref:Toxin-antitoxin system HicB family antitoxin n=1 Tax=Cellulomonas flavigena (strain ATCC 482 / DSM 20109 / BCRC 11376 / JCM 18109 / NBRC 3775 / NCIMB 8073 / NRS 134) TaxID=446466 RepID=D5UCT6_CELFN|nr:hypothetical protein [Cellulomonas flavigena]ADG76321.1 conserved hypothetical protein [Cellulomonas flavigena DSM 20109]
MTGEQGAGERPTAPDDARGASSGDGPRAGRRERKQVLLRLDPAVHDALARWAADELRSVNAQIDLLLRRALQDAGRMPSSAAPSPRRGRPPASD